VNQKHVATATLAEQCKASLDVPCGATCSRGARRYVGVRTWVCSAGEYRTMAEEERTLHARTCAHARPHALVNPCTHTHASRRRPPAKSAISQNPQLLTGKRNRTCICARQRQRYRYQESRQGSRFAAPT
jgi:hypothetical protein